MGVPRDREVWYRTAGNFCDKKYFIAITLGTGQYSKEYGTGTFATGPTAISDLAQTGPPLILSVEYTGPLIILVYILF